LKIQKYKHDLDISYTLGATLTYELVKCRPRLVERILISSNTEYTEGINKLLEICEKNSIVIEKNDKAFNILSPKGNCFVIGVFRKEKQRLENGNHIVLVNPSDAGNMGTIVRTATGFGIKQLAIIRPAVDFYDPKTIRATMGAAFHIKAEYFNCIEDYCSRFPENMRYAFMLTSSKPLTEIEIKKPYSLIFGNEATGLPENFANFCQSVIIKHSKDIDSLNLPMAAGIAMFSFTKEDWKIC